MKYFYMYIIVRSLQLLQMLQKQLLQMLQKQLLQMLQMQLLQMLQKQLQILQTPQRKDMRSNTWVRQVALQLSIRILPFPD
jgi:hypothetical protein